MVVVSTPEHAELVALAEDCITKWHAHHYRGFAKTQWEFFENNGELKPLLYTFRVLLTGIHLMRTGEVQADLRELAGGPSYLPDRPSAEPGLHDLLVRARLSR